MKSISLLSLFIILLSYFSNAQVVKINDLNFDKEVSKGEWMVYFYADWCGHCQRFAPVFEEIELAAHDKELEINFGKINIEENPQLASRFYITSLPTLFHIKDKQVRKFTIPRTQENIMRFIEEKEWEKIKPRGFISSPFSIVGRWVGYTSVIGAFMSNFGKWIQQYVNLYFLVGFLTVVLFACTYYFIKMNMPESVKKNLRKKSKASRGTKKIAKNSGLKVDLKEDNEEKEEKENDDHDKKE